MSESKHKRIWLEPAHESDAYGERQWCQQNVWGDNADEYVLASSLSKRPALSPSIASLQAENERLKALLKPFADEAGEYAETWPNGAREKPTKFNLGDLRAARAALEPRT